MRAVFIDRDGVLNRWIPDGYVLREEDIVVNTKIVDALAQIDRDAFSIVIISNQSCVGRGLVSIERLTAIMHYVVAEVAARGLLIDAWYCCPHAPNAGCGCRKPDAGLIRAAQRDLLLNPKRSYFIGDQATDMTAAERAGVRGLLIRPDCVDDLRPHVALIAQELLHVG